MIEVCARWADGTRNVYAIGDGGGPLVSNDEPVLRAKPMNAVSGRGRHKNATGGRRRRLKMRVDRRI